MQKFTNPMALDLNNDIMSRKGGGVSSSQTLQGLHMTQHTQVIKPYSCMRCMKKFKSEGGLKYHVKRCGIPKTSVVTDRIERSTIDAGCYGIDGFNRPISIHPRSFPNCSHGSSELMHAPSSRDSLTEPEIPKLLANSVLTTTTSDHDSDDDSEGDDQTPAIERSSSSSINSGSSSCSEDNAL
jgi:hypothetical protein